MVKSNEFTSATLAGAVRKATAAYDRRCLFEAKSQRRCNDLILRMSGLSREAGRYVDEAARLQRQVDSLRREGAEALAFAVVAALSGLAASLLRLRRLLKVIERMKKGRYSRDDILELLALIGPLLAAASAVRAATKFAEANELAREAEDLGGRSERVGRAYMQAFDEYAQLGCGENPGFTGI